ncbi:MAG: ribose 5-phosphate isomerase A [Candidatus Bathyarchaeota archaeon]
MERADEAKRRAAVASTELVRSGQIVGLGSGSTANYMIEELGRRVRREKLRIMGVSTSIQTAELAAEWGIPLTTLDDHPRLDIAIDGADQVDPCLNLIKGMGGALTREKIVDSAAEMLAIVVDEGKMAPQLGVNQVVPVEVIPFAAAPVMRKLAELGGKSSIRTARDKGGCFTTDNGNCIIDVDFGSIIDAKRLEMEIKMVSGVVESGLFVEMAKIVYVGSNSCVRKIERRMH